MLEYKSHYAIIEYGEYSSTHYGAHDLTGAMREALSLLDYYGIDRPIRRLVVGGILPVCSGAGGSERASSGMWIAAVSRYGHVNEQELPVN